MVSYHMKGVNLQIKGWEENHGRLYEFDLIWALKKQKDFS